MAIHALKTTFAEQQSVLEHTFKAPRQTLFKMFTSSEHLKQWWHPDGWTTTDCIVDFRIGGVWRYCFTSTADGKEVWVNAVYNDIVEPERIVYTDTFVEGNGKKSTELPERHNTVLFTEQNGHTTLTLDITYSSPTDLKTMIDIGMVEGITQSWNRLEAYLAQQ